MTPPDWLRSPEVKTFMKGYTNTYNDSVQAGEALGSDQKSHITVPVLDALVDTAFREGKNELHFLFSLQWNLISRSESAAGICFSHLAWDSDHLSVVTPRTKKDQGPYHNHIIVASNLRE